MRPQCLCSALSFVAKCVKVDSFCTVSQWMLKDYVLHRSIGGRGGDFLMFIFVIK